MAENEKNALAELMEDTNKALEAMSEGTILAVTAGYLAGKEAGRKEAQAQAGSTPA